MRADTALGATGDNEDQLDGFKRVRSSSGRRSAPASELVQLVAQLGFEVVDEARHDVRALAWSEAEPVVANDGDLNTTAYDPAAAIRPAAMMFSSHGRQHRGACHDSESVATWCGVWRSG